MSSLFSWATFLFTHWSLCLKVSLKRNPTEMPSFCVLFCLWTWGPKDSCQVTSSLISSFSVVAPAVYLFCFAFSCPLILSALQWFRQGSFLFSPERLFWRRNASIKSRAHVKIPAACSSLAMRSAPFHSPNHPFTAVLTSSRAAGRGGDATVGSSAMPRSGWTFPLFFCAQPSSGPSPGSLL